MTLETTLKHLTALANNALSLWDLPDGATARLINVSENVTYLVEATGGFKSVLRVHRENYHSQQAIQSELDWIAALDTAGVVVTPGIHLGKNGKAIQIGHSPALNVPRYMVMFAYIDGHPPDESGDMRAGFEELGQIAARTHVHTVEWQRPVGFERLRWDANTVFGADATWGNWRDAPNVTPGIRDVLERLEQVVCQRLQSFGKAPDRYGLIHADMRLANLIIAPTGTRLIDFDDCGFGWHMYDFAAAISFIEDDPRIPELRAAWVRGYRSVRDLAAEDEAEIDTFIMLRRMALLAWIGSHLEAPEPQSLAPDFAHNTAKLAQMYLESFSA